MYRLTLDQLHGTMNLMGVLARLLVLQVTELDQLLPIEYPLDQNSVLLIET